MTPATLKALAAELPDIAREHDITGHSLECLQKAAALLEQIGGADADPEKLFLKVYGSEMLGSTARVFAARYANALRAQFLAALAQATPSDTERGLYEAAKKSLAVLDRLYLDIVTSDGNPAIGLLDAQKMARAALTAYESKHGSK